MSASDPISRLQAAVEAAQDWHQAAESMRTSLTGETDPAFPFFAGLSYRIASESESRVQPFAPEVEAGERQFPPAIDSIPDNWLQAWREAAIRMDHDMVRARFGDLVWQRRYGSDAHQLARAASDASVRLGLGPWLGRFDGLQAIERALALAREVGDPKRQKSAIAAALEFATRAADADGPPGLAIAMLERLAELPPRDRPGELADRFKTLATRSDLNEHLADGVLAQLVSLTEGEESSDWKQRRIDLWRTLAERSTGLLKSHHLLHAIAIARQYGYRNDMTSLRKALQEIGPDDYDFQEVKFEMPVDRERDEETLKWIVGDDGWQAALQRFVRPVAPSGLAERNRQFIESLMQRYVFSTLGSQMPIDERGYPIALIAGPAGHLEAQLREHETRSAAYRARLFAPALFRIEERYGRPSPEDLTKFFTTPLIVTDIGERIGRALSLWWMGDYDESGHVLLPRLEAVIRRMCEEVGIVTYREPIDLDTGGARGLGDLLRELEGRMDESWRRYLGNLLVVPLGFNLRNRALHGLHPKISQFEAGLLLHAACYLRSLQPQDFGLDFAVPESSEGSTKAVDTLARSPIEEPPPGHVLTFGYGSNMCLGRMRCRVPSATPVVVAELRGYRFAFNKRSSKDGSVKANAIKTNNPTHRVLGVVFDLLESELHWLDDAEGLNGGYGIETLQVTEVGGPRHFIVRTYEAER